MSEKPNRPYEWMKAEVRETTGLGATSSPKINPGDRDPDFCCMSAAWSRLLVGNSCLTLMKARLWVRATMPYTISFEEASKIAPQIRTILMSYPQVTVVASELGRPDDGTDPTGFFNCEFYVGLKSYKDKAWTADVSDKKQLIESINQKLIAFPWDYCFQLYPARGRCRGRSSDRAQEFAGGQNLWG